MNISLEKAKNFLITLVLLGSSIALLSVQPDFKIMLSVLSAIIAFVILITFQSKEEENVRLDILKTIMSDNGYDQIITLKQVSELELNADSISVVTEDLLTDISKEKFCEYKNIGNDDTVGIFYSEVHENLNRKNPVSYTYFLKDNGESSKKNIELFMDSHNDPINVNFILIPKDEFCFLSEIYLYKCKKDKVKNNIFKDNVITTNKATYQHYAVEWLPSISNQLSKNMFYINLNSKQVNTLSDILHVLEKKYKYIRI